MMKALVLPAVLLLVAMGAVEPSDNPLLDELLDQGVAIPKGPVMKLPPPLLRQAPDAAGAKAVLAKAADRYPLELFLKRADAAPFNLKINSVNDAKGQRRGQVMDLWFVAHGTIEKVVQKDVIGQLLVSEGGRGGKASEFLTPEQLRQRNIEPTNDSSREERYATLDITFLDKVTVTGITRNVKTSSPKSVVLAMKLDERFENDKEYPNRWRSIDRQGDKGEKLGPPHPYAGLGGYVIVTELPEPAGALFVEMHFAFHEPPEWFGGPNLLRSKLPVVIQENVRTFRRKLSRD